MKPKDNAQLMERIRVAFLCKHKRDASDCSRCKGKDWRDSLTESGKKLGQVAEELINSKHIEAVEIEEYLAKKRARRRIKKLANGVGIIIAGYLVFAGGQRTLRLLFRKEEEPQK